MKSLIKIFFTPTKVNASVFNGGGFRAGLDLAKAIQTGGPSDIRIAVTNLIKELIALMGLAAVTVIIIAGIMLMIGGSSESVRSRAKLIIVYTIIGLLIIQLASAFVTFVIEAGANNVV